MSENNMTQNLPRWYEVLLVMALGVFGLIFAVLNPKWSANTKWTFFWLIIFWPVGLFYLNDESEWDKEQEYTAKVFIGTIITLNVLCVCIFYSLMMSSGSTST